MPFLFKLVKFSEAFETGAAGSTGRFFLGQTGAARSTGKFLLGQMSAARNTGRLILGQEGRTAPLVTNCFNKNFLSVSFSAKILKKFLISNICSGSNMCRSET